MHRHIIIIKSSAKLGNNNDDDQAALGCCHGNGRAADSRVAAAAVSRQLQRNPASTELCFSPEFQEFSLLQLQSSMMENFTTGVHRMSHHVFYK
jgi:hypothetical protein